ASRAFGGDTDGSSDLWVSYMIRQIEDNNPDQFSSNNGSTFGTQFNEAAAPNREFLVRPKSSSGFDSTHDANVGIFKDPIAVDEDFNMVDGVTYLVVAKFSPIDFGAFTGTTSEATLWVLDPTDVADALVSGLSEVSLDNQNQTSVTGSITPTFGVSGLDSSDVLNVLAYNGTAQFDELRYADTLADAVLVPEPATLGLAVLGGGMLLGRRRTD
ncbi:MAG: PEP-CTERM sorting domain-containing protein, partial [Planctomycetota bacterium]